MNERSVIKTVLLSMSGNMLLLIGATLVHAAPDCRGGGEISLHCGEAPSAWFDDDRLWVVFAQEGHAWVTSSRDQGESFTDPVQVNAVPEDIEVNGENRPKVLVDGDGTVYVSWTQETEGRFTGDIRFTRSTDGGRRFEAPRTINDDGLLTSHRFESLFLTESGHLYITWLDQREREYARERGGEYRGSAVFHTVSTDGGESFAPNRRVADHSCECCRIAVAAHGDDGVALLWRHVFEGHVRDHAFATLTPDGEVNHYSRATHDEWRIEACPHHGPSMDRAGESGAQDGDYHLSWFTNSASRQGIFYGRHEPGAGETALVREIDGSPGASHPQVAQHDGMVHLVWKRFDGQQTRLLWSFSRDKGESWSEASTLAVTEDGSDHPLLIRGPEALHVSWLTREEGYRLLALEATGQEPVAGGSRPDGGNGDGAAEEEQAAIRPFTADTLASIRADYAGEPFVLALWSVTCPPCMIELAMLGELRKEHPDLPLVLVSTDHISRREEAEDFLIEYELDDMVTWMFADRFSDRLRFTIDPQWYGELPRSYHFDADHEPEAHSGVLTEAQLREWLDLQ